MRGDAAGAGRIGSPRRLIPLSSLVGRARDSVLAWRDRRLADPSFREWALRFPLTRPVARARAAGLFDLCAGFIYAQVLQACVQLDMFETLSEGPQDVGALAMRLELPPPEALRLLEAAAALELVARRRDRYGLGRLGAALVQAPGLLAMIRHHALVYDDLRDPVALLRHRRADTRLGAYWDYAAQGESAAYTALMAASQPMVAAQVLGAVDVRRYRCLLDVGGGDGSFLLAAAQAAPGLQLMLADLPGVAEAAQARLGGRASVHGVILPGALPTGADIVSLVRVLHDHDDDMAARILQSVRAALPAGGTILVAEPMAHAPGAARVGAYFAMYLLAMGRGRPRSAAELSSMLRAAGFARPRLRRTVSPMIAQVLTARAA